MKALSLVLGGYVALLMGISLASYLDMRSTTDRLKSTVYAVCEYTRTTDEESQSCIKAQEVSNTEYLCKKNSPLPDNTCWVEVK